LPKHIVTRYYSPVVVVVNNLKATYSCFCPLTPEGQRPGAAVSGFLFSAAMAYGAITQPSLGAATKGINVANLGVLLASQPG